MKNINPYANCWMTESEAISFLNISPVEFNKLVSNGKISRYKFGDTFEYSKENILLYQNFVLQLQRNKLKQISNEK